MKKITALILLLSLLVSLTACHGRQVSRDAAPTETTDTASVYQIPEEFDTSRNYEITFWAKNDTNATQVSIYKQAIADFQALYPNITVNLRLYTDYSRIYNDVITNIATDTTPNVCITYPDHIATYLTGEGTVVPLDDLFTDARYGLGGSEVRFDSPTKEEIIPQFLAECAFDGHYYAIPYMRSTESCYVNKTFVEKLGYELPEVLTWDFVWEVAEAATAKDADGNYLINGQKVMIPFLYKSTDNMMIQMLKQKDAGYSTAEGDVLLFNDTTKELLYTISEHTKTGAFSTFKISSYPANFLNAGQCIFAVDSTAGATWMGSNAPLIDIAEDKLVQFETEVMLIPFMYKSTDNMMIQMLKQKGAGYSTALGEIQLFNDTTKELLYTVADHSVTKAFNTFKASGYPANFLNAGQCIFAIDSTAGATWMGSDAPLIDIAEEKLVQFETVVMTIPQFDPANPQMISQGPSMCVFNKEDPQEVLASWLFAQYMLTNEVQIAYSQTEGYAPVTSKAQQSAEYQDYLSRSGEDNDLYYPIKIDATRLLMENTGNTFVTPVFNGSASLRNAAGQLIEEVKKSARRGETVDDAYLNALFEEMVSLYRLDQISNSGGKVSLGELPGASKALLSVLALCWICMGAYVVVDKLKKKNL